MIKINILIILFSLSFEVLLENGIYNFIFNDLYVNYYNNELIISKSDLSKVNSRFRIKNILEKLNISFYFIESLNKNDELFISNNQTIPLFVKYKFKKKKNFLWTFIKKKNNKYIIQNRNYCYIKVINFKIKCQNISIEEASQFKFIKIYEEVEINKLNYSLLEKEPIDVLIKYIDLRDPLLKRKKIHQIKKDFDNEELRYSVRSILKNIPWIRKIFILMPNDKVRYFKDYNLIKNKIVYVKDKDFLGHDSSNSLAFQFRLWNMRKFGISDNFIVMDDDYFIGRPLKKTDFFYTENNKVVPLIITSRFLNIKRNHTYKKYKKLNEIIKKVKTEQNGAIFQYSKYLTYVFLLNLFQKSIIIPKFTHNAIPVNIKEIKEVHDLIYNSEYKLTTLDSLYRHIKSIQFQTFYLGYTFIKYRKKVKHVKYKYIKNKYSINSSYNYDLFCINTGAYDNSNLELLKTRIVMEYLFNKSTPYEIINYSFSSISLNTVKLLNKEITKSKEKYKSKLIKIMTKFKEEVEKNKKNFLFLLNIYLILLLLFFKICFRYYFKICFI